MPDTGGMGEERDPTPPQQIARDIRFRTLPVRLIPDREGFVDLDLVEHG